jgi:glycosyltransferase involved in cell wall biosynthesis
MRVGIVYYSSYPQNRGIEQLAHGLRRIGHEPYVIARRPKGEEPVSSFQGIPVIQLPRPDEKPFVELPVPFNPYWIHTIESISREQELDALISRETHLSYPVLRTARRMGVPAFLDMRENLRAVYAAEPRQSLVGRLLRSEFVVGTYESWVVPKFDHVFTVSQELRKWVEEEFGLSKECISVLGNYPTDLFMKRAKRARSRANSTSTDGSVQLIHAGYVLESKGIQDVIRAVRRLVDQGIDHLKYRVVGGGTSAGSYVEPLKALTTELGLEEVVEFEPYPPADELARTLAACDIGVCSYHLNQLTHQTLPGKLFEFMAVGLPILSSARKPVVRILEREKCGVIYSSRSPESIAQTLLPLIENASLRQKMGRRGVAAVQDTYNSSRNVQVLEEVFGRGNT